MMGYTIGNDEVALILSPVNFNEKGEWSGHISTSIAMGPEESVLDSKIIPEVLRCATLLSAFLDIAHEHPRMVELCEKQSATLLNCLIQDIEEEKHGLPEVEIQTSGGQVFEFKTKKD